jgi:putative ABC transport system permease protein
MAVVSEDLIKKYFPVGRDPIGRYIRIDLLTQPMPPGFLKAPQFDASFEIVGVVGTARNTGLRDHPEAAVYLPDALLYPPGAFLLLRTASEPLAFANAAREAVRSVDPGQPVMLIRSLDQWLGQATAYPRFATFLFGIFGAIGMTLAAIGVYSVVSYAVARRTREFGVRMALGASPAHVFRLVIASTGRVLLAGLVLGIALSIFASRALGDRIEGMGTADPFMLAAVPLVLSAAAFLACYVPARTATRIQPMDALRHE